MAKYKWDREKERAYSYIKGKMNDVYSIKGAPRRTAKIWHITDPTITEHMLNKRSIPWKRIIKNYRNHDTPCVKILRLSSIDRQQYDGRSFCPFKGIQVTILNSIVMI